MRLPFSSPRKRSPDRGSTARLPSATLRGCSENGITTRGARAPSRGSAARSKRYTSAAASPRQPWLRITSRAHGVERELDRAGDAGHHGLHPQTGGDLHFGPRGDRCCDRERGGGAQRRAASRRRAVGRRANLDMPDWPVLGSARSGATRIAPLGRALPHRTHDARQERCTYGLQTPSPRSWPCSSSDSRPRRPALRPPSPPPEPKGVTIANAVTSLGRFSATVERPAVRHRLHRQPRAGWPDRPPAVPGAHVRLRHRGDPHDGVRGGTGGDQGRAVSCRRDSRSWTMAAGGTTTPIEPARR